jgi:hypothetical protein
MRNSIVTAIVARAFGIVTAIAAQTAIAQPGAPLRNIHVDVSPLRSTAGEQTAAWVQHDLSVQLAQALAGRNASNGAPVTLRIEYLTLSSGIVDCGASRDRIGGVAIIGGVRTPLQATTSYQPAPIDRVAIEQISHDRVSQLVQALVFWVTRDLT